MKRTLSVLAFAALLPPSVGIAAPQAQEVCASMAQRGRQLLGGDATGFYFVDALGGEFPLPTFLKTVEPRSASAAIAAEVLPPPGGVEPRAADPGALRHRANVCGWFMNVSFGSIENLEGYAGPLEDKTEQLLALDGLTVRVLTARGLKLRSVVASNEHGYAAFVVDSPASALWLLDLFAQLQKPGTR